MERTNFKNIIRNSIIIVLAIIVLGYVGTTILKYQVEGEKNMPFTISKLMLISNAEGVEKDEQSNVWNMDIMQNNDVYIEIMKNKHYKEKEIIESITLYNFVFSKEPQIGSMIIYRPSADEKRTYDYKDESIIQNELIYVGSEQTNLKNLEIANQGGLILVRFCNKNVTTFNSDEQIEIKHDGTLLKNTGITLEQIESKVSFDITIKLISGVSYKANIKLDLPAGNIIEEGTSSKEEKDLSDIIFKRV